MIVVSIIRPSFDSLLLAQGTLGIHSTTMNSWVSRHSLQCAARLLQNKMYTSAGSNWQLLSNCDGHLPLVLPLHSHGSVSRSLKFHEHLRSAHHWMPFGHEKLYGAFAGNFSAQPFDVGFTGSVVPSIHFGKGLLRHFGAWGSGPTLALGIRPTLRGGPW